MLLEAQGIRVAFEGAQILHGVSISVEAGEFVALLGPNGSGKSTLMNGISRQVPLQSGRILIDGREIQELPGWRLLQLGCAHVLERHRMFPQMTVWENLVLGAGPGAPPRRVEAGLERCHALFPRLRDRSRQLAGSLSGGEQQMCALARGLMSEPRLLLLDEPFIGLSPHMRDEVERALHLVQESGVAILMIEQNVREALRMSQRAYVLRTGRVVLAARSAELDLEAVRDAFMGLCCGVSAGVGGPAGPVAPGSAPVP
ncbi:ABC transporter ATP-binding protein [Roseomonas chloroacetimidivorans]|uniref:ABC transporter ATP-binding protein n=1 Tax=Roseomonas chloroacetimidivorans TaxID=1766656 RepID=UPI003C7239B7